MNLALKWYPRTKRLFVISGTLNHDKAVESSVRDDLRAYESTVSINYLTDLAPDQLTNRIRTLPKDSLIFYAWQQVLDTQGRLLEAPDVLALVARDAKVPIYGRSHFMVGRGIVGGYVWTQEANAAKLADIAMRVVNGTRPKDIPIERGPDIPMFDWRELQRWGIDQNPAFPSSASITVHPPGVDLFVAGRLTIDVVLLDMTLPGKTGRTVLEELQRIAPDVKVIVTSAYGPEQVRNLLNGLRTSGYIQKPYDLLRIETVLRESFAQTGTIRPAPGEPSV